MSKFIANLRQRRRVVGTMLFEMVRPSAIERLCSTGVDFLIVDMEHSSLSKSDVAQALNAIRLNGVFPMLRVPSFRAHDVNMGFDLGARGVMVPYVESMFEAREALAAARLRPLRGNVLGEYVATGTTSKNAQTIWKRNIDNLLFIGIESNVALEHLEQIVTSGIDGVFVGMWDLTYSLGVPGEYDHVRVQLAFRNVLKACKHAGIVCSIWPLPSRELSLWSKRGMSMLIVDTDLDIMTGTLRDAIVELASGLDRRRRRD